MRPCLFRRSRTATNPSTSGAALEAPPCNRNEPRDLQLVMPQWVVMPSLDDLLDTKRTAVTALEEKQRSRQLKLDNLAGARQLVETAWFAVAGGIALGHAAENSSFHATLAAILDERLTAKRDQKLFGEWKAAPPETPGQAAETAPELPKARKVRPRNQPPEIDLDDVSVAELLQNIEQFEADALLARKEEAAAQDDVKKATKALRKRDAHWRIKTGEVVLEHAKRNDDFRQSLDRIFEQRVATQHRPLLDRWRNATAPDAAPPPDDAHRGWKPKKLPDGSWGAVFQKTAGKTLPEELVGAAIVVRTRKGDEWNTRIVKIVDNDDKMVVVRTEERHDSDPASGAPAAASAPNGNEDGALAPRKSSPPAESTA